MVGGLLYLTNTCPKIMFTVCLVSRFMHSPTKQHFGAAKMILHHIQGAVNYGIWCRPVSNFKLLDFYDSDWAGSLDDRRITTGFLFSLRSGAISWMSKKQHIVALSFSKAEYVAVTSTTCQALWIRRIL